jgi:hypothetical protein
LRRADHSSKGVLPCVLIRLRNLRCEAAKVLIRTIEPLMMMMMMMVVVVYSSLLLIRYTYVYGVWQLGSVYSLLSTDHELIPAGCKRP